MKRAASHCRFVPIPSLPQGGLEHGGRDRDRPWSERPLGPCSVPRSLRSGRDGARTEEDGRSGCSLGLDFDDNGELFSMGRSSTVAHMGSLFHSSPCPSPRVSRQSCSGRQVTAGAGEVATSAARYGAARGKRARAWVEAKAASVAAVGEWQWWTIPLSARHLVPALLLLAHAEVASDRAWRLDAPKPPSSPVPVNLAEPFPSLVSSRQERS